MYSSTITPSKLTRFALDAKRWFGILAAIAMVLALFALVVPGPLTGKAFFSASLALLVLCAVLMFVLGVHRRNERIRLRWIEEIVKHDPHPALFATQDGTILFRNMRAAERFPDTSEDTVTGVLSTSVANPTDVIMSLQAEAGRKGGATRLIEVRTGSLYLHVLRATDGRYIWRIENREDQGKARLQSDVPVITASAKEDSSIVEMNAAAHKLLGDTRKDLSSIFPRIPDKAHEICELNTNTGTCRMQVFKSTPEDGLTAFALLPAPNASIEAAEWSAFQNLPVPLLKVNPLGDVSAYNRMAARLIGVSLDNGAHLSDFMEGLGRSITDWLSETLTGRAGQNSEFLRLKRLDKEVFVQVTLNRITEAGQPMLLAVLNDATELKSLEAQFVQSQKMQAIGQLAGGVAHDFNNLLTAISGHCDLLLLRHDQGDPDFSDLVQINQNANRAAALVGQLLAFSRKQTLRPETLDMRDTLSDLTHLLNRLVGEKITLSLTHDPVLAPIRADKRQLEQVLMNLVVNARDAMPAGGEIRIQTKQIHLAEPLSRDRVSVPDGKYVTVQVSDDGVGIASDKLQKVFEPFYTTKRTGEGTGLGLSTAYGIIKQTGGYIFVDSTVNAGTCFTLYFPVLDKKESQTTPVKQAKTKPVSKHGDGVILLVEDEAPVRAFASRALRLRGYTVLEADSAEAALKVLEDDTLNVDIFVTDVVMPGMDGPTWVREALQTRPDVRTVFVSGYAEDSFSEKQMKIPNSVFLPKPFSLSDLTETVNQQLA